MSFSHEALDVLLGRLGICSIARLCTTNKDLGDGCLRLLGNQPARLQALIMDQVQKAAALARESATSYVSKQRLENIASMQSKCVSAVQWLLRTCVDGQPVVGASLVAHHPDFLQELVHIPNVPLQMACVLVQDAGVSINEYQLLAAVGSGIEGIEVWVLAVRTCNRTSDLPAWIEVICCNDVPYMATLPLPTRVDSIVQLLQLAVNCQSNIALSLLDKQTTRDWQQQIPPALLQQLVLTSISRGHDPCILQRLMLVLPVTPDTISAALRIQLQALTQSNCVYNSKGGSSRLKHLPLLLQHESASQLGPETVAEVALRTARLVDWPDLMLHYVCKLPAMQQLSPQAIATLMGTAIQHCEASKGDTVSLLSLMLELCKLPSTSHIEPRDQSDLMLAAEGVTQSTVSHLLRHCTNFVV